MPSQRKIDIGYRGRNVPAWLGELGQEKIRIGVRVRDEAPAYGLNVDISFREEDRLYGDAWIKFVSSCKGMLGVESGSSVVDFTGDIQRNVERHVSSKPGTSFAELRERYFAEIEGKINFAQISPRCFESAALRTLMILYEGEYSGVLVPWRHYVPLKKDHSNLAEVVDVLRDASRLDQIVTQAYEEVAKNPKWSFAQSVADVDTVIDSVFVRRWPAASRILLQSLCGSGNFQTVDAARSVRSSEPGLADFSRHSGALIRFAVQEDAAVFFDIATFREWRRNRAQLFMCGIAGILNFRNEPIGQIIVKLNAADRLLAHRGPDGHDIWIAKNQAIGLLHRRLAIIDLTSSGQQPMAAPNGTVITYNGEIYNYIELRAELAPYWNFRSTSDTEVILAAYERWGTACVDHLRGMFAFALWDGRKQELFCARDRFGIKPFYYCEEGGLYCFASEAKALLPFVRSLLIPKL